MLTFRHLAPLSLLVLAGAATAADASKKDPRPATTATSTSTAAAEQGRDWSRIDTDRDGYISPAEMEKFLADNPGPLKK